MVVVDNRVLHCSREACQRVWTAAPDEVLALFPVIDECAPESRAWHPCPECVDTFGPLAEFAHAMRARTSRELADFAVTR